LVTWEAVKVEIQNTTGPLAQYVMAQLDKGAKEIAVASSKGLAALEEKIA
jgi:hypothetical protein